MCRELEKRIAIHRASEDSVFTLCCTQRLLTRLKGARIEITAAEPTTLLGDWNANLLYIGRLQLVLAVSERTFLPVVLPAAPVSSLVTRLHRSVEDVLRALSLDAARIDRELAQMETVVLARTAATYILCPSAWCFPTTSQHHNI